MATVEAARLPLVDFHLVWEEATLRGVELTAVPTADTCRLLDAVDRSDVYAILHVTC